MIYGKAAHFIALGNKMQDDKAKRLHAARREAEADGDLFESDEEIKTMPLKEVAKRLREIDNGRSLTNWTDIDEARWERLAWRAKRLGVSNPFSLTKDKSK